MRMRVWRACVLKAGTAALEHTPVSLLLTAFDAGDKGAASLQAAEAADTSAVRSEQSLAVGMIVSRM